MKLGIKNKKNKHILFQTFLIIVLLFGGILTANAIVNYNNGTSLYLRKIRHDKRVILEYIKYVFDSYASIDWLFNYWEKNYANIDSTYSYDEEKYQELPYIFRVNTRVITVERLLSLPPEQQRLFAEYCYKKIIDTVVALTENFDYQEMYCAKILENQEVFLFFYDAKDRGDNKNFFLGETFPSDIENRPLIQKIYDNKKAPEEFEHVKYNEDGETHEFLYGFSPFLRNGEITCVLILSFGYSEAKDRVKELVMLISTKNFVFLIVAGVFLSVVLRAIVLKPLLQIQSSVRNYAKKRNSALVIKEMKQIKSRNEIGRLANDFSHLAEELDRYTKETAELSAEKAKIDSELSLAARIQNDALTKNFLSNDKFQIYATMKPAKNVGGDLYDFFMTDENHIAVIIGDVSGKGISAALFMMKVKSLLKSTALEHKNDPEKIITVLNQELCNGNDAMMFITMWFGIMDISTGKIVYVNAGHEYPMLKRDNKFEIIKRQHFLSLGISEFAEYHSENIQLEKGNTLFIYTDGVAEANNKNEELFGFERLQNALNENPELNPQELINNIMKKIKEFVGDAPQFDDTTMLSLKYF